MTSLLGARVSERQSDPDFYRFGTHWPPRPAPSRSVRLSTSRKDQNLYGRRSLAPGERPNRKSKVPLHMSGNATNQELRTISHKLSSNDTVFTLSNPRDFRAAIVAGMF